MAREVLVHYFVKKEEKKRRRENGEIKVQ